MQQRLQKIIARAGVTSRRKAEELIRAGRVSVNGAPVRELGAKADPRADRIAIDGTLLRRAQPPVYLLFYKPRGVVSTLRDPEGRRSISAFVARLPQRLYPVGRLDYNSEGLLLLTNDGDLAHGVTHASSELPKTYWVKVSGRPDEAQLGRLRRGIFLEGRRTAPAQIRLLDARQRGTLGKTSDENPWLEVVLIEGRSQQIRRMFASIGHPVEKLRRVGIGFLEPGALEPGDMRALTPAEVTQLKRLIAKRGGEAPAGAPHAARRKPPRRVAQRGTRRRQRE